MSISVVINTKNAASGNSEHNFSDTLKSVAFADEIIIVDMASTDDTVAIAEKFTKEIFFFDDVGFVEPARNFAIKKATKDWILVLDADEVIPETLSKKITALANGDATADAYLLPRKNMVFGTWFHSAGWWPDYQLRLFKRGVVIWDEKIHSVPEVNGKTDKLAPREDFAIEHYNYQSVEQYLERLNRYTTHEAKQRDKVQLTPAGVIGAFEAELMSRLFKHDGIEGGMHGVSLSFLQSFYEVAVILKQWELNKFPKSKTDKKTIEALERLTASLDYWLADLRMKNSSGLTKLVWKLRRKIGV